MQSTTILSSAGTIRYSFINPLPPPQGPWPYNESFENGLIGTFTFEDPTVIESYTWGDTFWGADIFEAFRVEQYNMTDYAYGEVQTVVAQNQGRSIRLHSPASPIREDGKIATVWCGIAINLYREDYSSAGYPKFYVRYYIQFENLPTQDWKYGKLMHMHHGTYASSTAWVDVIRQSGQIYVRLRKMWTSNPDHYTAGIGVSYPLTTGTWYKFEVYYKYGITDGEYRLLINDEEIIAVTGEDTTPVISEVKYDGQNGNPLPEEGWPMGWDGGWENHDQSQTYNVYIDNFLFADWFYGREPPPDYTSNQMYYTGFEPGEEDTYVMVPYRGGQTEISTDIVHSGTQSIHCTGLKDRLWEADIVVALYDSSGADHGNITVQEGNPNEIGTYHFWGDYLLWTEAGPPYEPAHMMPRAWVFGNGFEVTDSHDLYMRSFVYLNVLEGYVTLQEMSGWIPGADRHSIMMRLKLSLSGDYIEVSLGVNKFDHDASKGDFFCYDQNGNVVGLWTATYYEPIKVTISSLPTEVQPKMNEWFSVETRFAKSDPNSPGYPHNGGVQVWINGDLAIDRMDLDSTEAPYPSGHVIGIVYTQSNCQTELYIDNLAVDVKYI